MGKIIVPAACGINTPDSTGDSGTGRNGIG